MSKTAAAYSVRQIQDEFADAVLDGLGKEQKSIPCSYLYDDRGSELFEQITQTVEYYPTNTEIALLEEYANDIAALIGAKAILVEFGSGSSRKTKILIDALSDLAAYIPIDISEGALAEAEETLNRRYPDLRVVPVHADFNQPMNLPDITAGRLRLGFFPGSTIGNFSHAQASSFLVRAAKLLGRGNGLVIGVDLKKDRTILEAAYNDAQGVTAAFNLNLLERVNRELGGDFDVSAFAHRAFYNETVGRIEIYIESLKEQDVRVLGRRFHFSEGERTHTEHSHKYSLDEFKVLAENSGWATERVWVDEQGLFSVHFLRVA